mmetsp:Transcript_17360/g.59932  ORF Transcript_17360/g.59932 Transcript_17360/m.59932 type:complete len:250 (+) Transcript_17360:202-951(+)
MSAATSAFMAASPQAGPASSSASTAWRTADAADASSKSAATMVRRSRFSVAQKCVWCEIVLSTPARRWCARCARLCVFRCSNACFALLFRSRRRTFRMDCDGARPSSPRGRMDPRTAAPARRCLASTAMRYVPRPRGRDRSGTESSNATPGGASAAWKAASAAISHSARSQSAMRMSDRAWRQPSQRRTRRCMRRTRRRKRPIMFERRLLLSRNNNKTWRNRSTAWRRRQRRAPSTKDRFARSFDSTAP